MVASSSFTALAETENVLTGVAPGEETTSQAPAESPSADPVISGGAESSASSPVTAAPVPEETSGSTTVTAGAVSGGGNSSTTVTAGSSAQTNTGGSAVVSPGSGTVVSGSGTITAGIGSSVVGPGGLTGGPGIVSQPQVSRGTDSFAGTVQNPIVSVQEKYSYDQMSRDINKLQSRYSSLMRTNVIGTTLDGRNLYEIIVGNPNASKHILIHAGIHAREYMTPLLVMKQLEYGLAFYSSGSYEGRLLSDMFNQVAVHYVPMVNPDGITLSQFGISSIRSESLRQTINQCYASDIALGRTSAAFDRYLNYWKANGRGVDLNQNFPADWEQVTTAPAPSYATYRGPNALSEPESQALANLAGSRTWAATISYHSMGNIIYWDYRGNKVSAQSKALADLVSAKTGYRLAGASGHGGFKDWVQIKDSPIPSLTLEVGSVSCPMPVTEFTDVWNRNNEVWALVMKYALEH